MRSLRCGCTRLLNLERQELHYCFWGQSHCRLVFYYLSTANWLDSLLQHGQTACSQLWWEEKGKKVYPQSLTSNSPRETWMNIMHSTSSPPTANAHSLGAALPLLPFPMQGCSHILFTFHSKNLPKWAKINFHFSHCIKLPHSPVLTDYPVIY